MDNTHGNIIDMPADLHLRSARFHGADCIRERSLRRVISICPGTAGVPRMSLLITGHSIGSARFTTVSKETRGKQQLLSSAPRRSERGAKLLFRPKFARKQRGNCRLGGTKLSRFRCKLSGLRPGLVPKRTESSSSVDTESSYHEYTNPQFRVREGDYTGPPIFGASRLMYA